MHSHMSPKKREEKMTALQEEITQLQAALGEGEDAETIVSKHIKSLHLYNEAKDAAQILMGRLAQHRQMTIRQIHEEYGLTDRD